MKSDKETSLQDLKDLVEKFGKDRNWQKHHTPKNLAMNISIEAAELMEHFLWEREGEPDKDEVAAELADVLFNCLNFANTSGIDVSQAFLKKYEQMQKKYPVEIFNKNTDSAEDYKRIKQEYRKGRK